MTAKVDLDEPIVVYSGHRRANSGLQWSRLVVDGSWVASGGRLSLREVEGWLSNPLERSRLVVMGLRGTDE
ncbi:hypothetical protein U1Q18_015287, partial [Sarracenia purpurea var. burkii]